MKKYVTNKELSFQLSIPLTKVRRYAKEILPPDPEATQQSGKSRKLGLRDAFKIYLCGHMIAKMGLLMEDVKNILHDLDPWLEKNGYYPDVPPPEPDEIIDYDIPSEEDSNVDVSGQQPWWFNTEIRIMRANTPSGFFYKTIKEDPNSLKIKTRKGKKIIQVEREEGYVLTPDMRYIVDEFSVYLLPITKIIGRFNRTFVFETPF